MSFHRNLFVYQPRPMDMSLGLLYLMGLRPSRLCYYTESRDFIHLKPRDPSSLSSRVLKPRDPSSLSSRVSRLFLLMNELILLTIIFKEPTSRSRNHNHNLHLFIKGKKKRFPRGLELGTLNGRSPKSIIVL